MAPAPDQRVWPAAWGYGLVCYNPKTGKTEDAFTDPLPSRVLCLYQPSPGRLWAGTMDNGIVIVDLTGKSLTKAGESEGLPHSHVRVFTADANGGLWVATSGGVIARRLRQNFRHYNR